MQREQAETILESFMIVELRLVLPRFPANVPRRGDKGYKKPLGVKWETRILRGSRQLALSVAGRLGASGIPGPASFPPGLGFPICRMGFQHSMVPRFFLSI